MRFPEPNRTLSRPLRPGCNIGIQPRNCAPGSLGCVVESLRPEEAGRWFLLTCEHVLAGPGGVVIEGSAIEQPAPRDQVGQLADFVIGRVVRGVGLAREGDAVNEVDAALGALLPGIAWSAMPLAGGAAFTTIADPVAGMAVVKFGAATGRQEGRITEVGLTRNVRYADGHEVAFAGVVNYACRCEPGDSGAAVVEAATGALVGLHFAGWGMQAVLCPIRRVFERLEVRLARSEAG